jgi:hypothetical protein
MPRKLTLREALKRYRIDSPIEEAAGRGAWQERAAEEVLGDAPAPTPSTGPTAEGPPSPQGRGVGGQVPAPYGRG